MFMKKRLLTSLLCVTMLMYLFTGCGNKSNNTADLNISDTANLNTSDAIDEKTVEDLLNSDYTKEGIFFEITDPDGKVTYVKLGETTLGEAVDTDLVEWEYVKIEAEKGNNESAKTFTSDSHYVLHRYCDGFALYSKPIATNDENYNVEVVRLTNSSSYTGSSDEPDYSLGSQMGKTSDETINNILKMPIMSIGVFGFDTSYNVTDESNQIVYKNFSQYKIRSNIGINSECTREEVEEFLGEPLPQTVDYSVHIPDNIDYDSWNLPDNVAKQLGDSTALIKVYFDSNGTFCGVNIGISGV
jgi:hypothetical protein